MIDKVNGYGLDSLVVDIKACKFVDSAKILKVLSCIVADDAACLKVLMELMLPYESVEGVLRLRYNLTASWFSRTYQSC
jgi:hypothetical protein